MNSSSHQNLLISRDYMYYILRIIELMCIILAHIIPPKFSFQLRNFDISLMLIVSGAVFRNSCLNNNKSYSAYLIFKKNLSYYLGTMFREIIGNPSLYYCLVNWLCKKPIKISTSGLELGLYSNII